MVAYIAETSATAGDDLGKARQAAALTIHASQGAHQGHRGDESQSLRTVRRAAGPCRGDNSSALFSALPELQLLPMGMLTRHRIGRGQGRRMLTKTP